MSDKITYFYSEQENIGGIIYVFCGRCYEVNFVNKVS